MQKLVWKNSLGDEIDLTSGNYGITEWEGFSNTSLNIQSQQVPFQDGGVFLDALMEQRELSVTLAMQDNGNLEERYRMRRELIHALNPKLGEGYLIYTNDFISKRIKCVAQIPLFETHNSNDSGTPKASLAWTACEPYWEDLEETEVTIGGGINIVNEGDVPTQVELVLQNGTSNPLIVNRRNLKKISLIGSFVEQIDINTNFGQKSIQSEVMEFNLVAGGLIRDACYAKNKTIYVGSQIVVEDFISGKIITTKKGEQVLWSITFGNNIFVAVGEQGTIITSEDALNWTIRESGVYQNIEQVIYKDGYFYARTGYYDHVHSMSTYGVLLRSSDGINWNIVYQMEQYGMLNDIIYGADRFVMSAKLNSTKYLLTSTDGENWTRTETTIDSYSFFNGEYIGIVHKGTGIGAYSEIYTSSNLEDWSLINSHSLIITISLYKDGVYYGLNITRLYKSNDLINWSYEEQTSEILKLIYTMQFELILSNGGINASQNGIDWNEKKDGLNYLRKCSFGKGIYCTLSSSDFYKSTDGVIWVKKITPIRFDCVKFLNGSFFGIGSGCIYTSDDCENWELQYQFETTIGISDITFGNGLYVICGRDSGIYTSPNLTAWTQQTSDIDHNEIEFKNIAFGNGIFIIATSSFYYSSGTQTQYANRVLRSVDGVHWTMITDLSSGDYQSYSVAFGNGVFVINYDIGESHYIAYSVDGLIWNRVNILIHPLRVKYENNLFALVGKKGRIAFSKNGVVWIYKNSVTNSDINDITYGNNKYVAIGGYLQMGFVLNSYIAEVENLISYLSADSDISFNLEVGNNIIVYVNDNNISGLLKYRQKYIGV